MPARADNPDGFWENLRFVSLNERLLAELGGAWDLPPSVPDNFDSPRFNPLRKEARSLVASFADAALWGWKDPRNCLTFRFWKSIHPKLRAVAILRNPLEMAYSLRKRNGTSLAFGIRLWENYMRCLLAATTPEDRLFTHYDAFFENAGEELGRIAQFIGLFSADTNGAARIVARGRRHSHFTLQQVAEAGISPRVIGLYKDLLAEAISQHRMQATCPDTELGVDSSLPRPGSGMNEFMPGMTDHIVDFMPEEWANRRDATLDRLQRECDHAVENARRIESERDTIRRRFVDLSHQLRDQSIQLSKLESRQQLLKREFRQWLQGIKKVIKFLDEFAAASERLRRSRRWKLSNPIAWLKARVSKQPQPGFGHLERVERKFIEWKGDHPEIENLDERIQSLASQQDPFADVGDASHDNSYSMTPLVPLESLEFAIHEQPKVSIIIPVFNQFQFTHACLSALEQYHDGISIEVIVVDDCSTDATPELISKIPGLVYLRNDSNSGFTVSCNHGAKAASGEYLLFLNNDTMVTRGWLKALLETFANHPATGLVGSKLVYPDGRLQEAGGIIWRDGSGWNRGKFQDANDPEYNYLRQVDYCSAASLMIPRNLFLELGGFDLRYAPAYYEDTDLAFRVREHGRKVLYQPLSLVVHYEGTTAGTDISAGVKRHQEINRATFTATWTKALAERPKNGDVASYSQPPTGRKRILVIDHHLPLPDRDSGSLRMFRILTILQQLNHQVVFLPDNLSDHPPYGDELRKRGVQFIHYPYAKSVRQYLELYGVQFDIVILSRCDFARKHIATVREHAPDSRIIFDTVDLHFLRQEREAELTQDPKLKLLAAGKRQMEYDLIKEADQTWVVSPAEAHLLRNDHPESSIEVVSNIVDVLGSATSFHLRQDILFIGSFQHPPNIDAVLFFTRDIFPLIRADFPRMKFYIIGDKAPPEVIALADENIIVTGYQHDVSSFFNSVRISVAPLRFGAGVKGKINQSMGFGVPVVATPIAVEGMSLISGKDVMIAENAPAFAAAVRMLYSSEQLWSEVSRNGLRKTQEAFSAETARHQLERLLSDSEALFPKAGATADSFNPQPIASSPIARAELSRNCGPCL